jgi:hypothetical protein
MPVATLRPNKPARLAIPHCSNVTRTTDDVSILE